MSDADLARRLSFLKLDAAALDVLKGMRPLIERELPGVLDAFYRHVSQWPEASRHFGGQSHMDHARSAQLRHWLVIAEGRLDQTYVESVRRIGKAHARLGLEPRWYIGGYAFLTSGLAQAILADGAPRGLLPDPARAALTRQRIDVFNRAVMLDMDYAISIYLEESEAAKKREVREIADRFDASVGGVVEAVASAAGQLSQTARRMSDIAGRTSERAVTVSAAAEEATSNVSVVATSAEQMGASVREISGQVSASARIASEAVTRAQTSAHTVQQLSEAADRIGQVVSMISDIAAQTNLLALNATIESARAGEAGRGFAVVAAEVKSLANQTARATEDIGNQIGGMQAATRQAVDAIGAIQRTIDEISAVSVAINAAVEEQSAATMEIARNTQEAAVGTQDVSRNIGHVQEGARETGDAAGEVVTAAEQLGQQASTLRTEVEAFLKTVRAA
jgi:ABC-type transporter Mla subunit MlaD